MVKDGLLIVPCSCLRCGAEVWHAAGGSTAGGEPLTFDLGVIEGEPYLTVHGCHCWEDEGGE